MGLGHRMPWPLQRLDGDMARPEQAQPRADRRASTAQPDMRTRIMSKQRKQLPEVSIFANNPFLEELLALRDSPEDEQLGIRHPLGFAGGRAARRQATQIYLA